MRGIHFMTVLAVLAFTQSVLADEIIQQISKPTKTTSISVGYKFPEVTLKPGQSILISVPPEYQNMPLGTVVLAHRQDPKDEGGKEWVNGKDTVPGITLVQVHARNLPENRAWRYWNGMSSGTGGGKFAESRPSPEEENLYEWTEHGSTGVTSYDSSLDELLLDKVKISSVGQDPVKVSGLILKLIPNQPSQLIEGIFSPGTKFHYKVGHKAMFGGGQAYRGTFPQALVLGGTSNAKLPIGWKKTGSTLEIPVPAGKKVVSVEVACGDSHPDQQINKDGGYGRPGAARISIGIGRNSATVANFISNENVPPEGLVVGAPTSNTQVAKEGDRIIITGTTDTLYIMGVRVGVSDN